MEMRRGGKEVDFQGGTYSLKTINILTCFYLIFTKIFSWKTSLDFLNKIKQI